MSDSKDKTNNWSEEEYKANPDEFVRKLTQEAERIRMKQKTPGYELTAKDRETLTAEWLWRFKS